MVCLSLPFKSCLRQIFLLLAGLTELSLQAQHLPAVPGRFTSTAVKDVPSALASLLPLSADKNRSSVILEKTGPSNPYFAVYEVNMDGKPLKNALIIARRNATAAMEVYMPLLPQKALEGNEAFSANCIIFNGECWQPASCSEEFSGNPAKAIRNYSDQSGKLLFSEDWLLRFSDSTVKARVFLPDPVSRLQLPYGGLLRDRSDSSSALLQAAMDTIFLSIRFDGDSFRLENPWLKLGDFSPPHTNTAVHASADSFLYDRNQPGFEEVNVFYHISRFRTFLAGLGFDSLARFPLHTDAHGMDGADQSAYSPLQEFLAFGDGNVDDAEDAAVIIHEYGHVLAHAAFPFGNAGQERRALEEGICDYLAGSYLRTFGQFLQNRIFRWDGNNEFWPGRSLVSSRMYPGDLSGSLYADGEIFCAALTAMESSLGREDLHRILLGALYGIGPNFTMPAAARQMLAVDSILFQGQHGSLIRFHFLERGIDPDLVVVSAEEEMPASETRIVFSPEGQAYISGGTETPSQLEILDVQGRMIRSFSPASDFSPLPSRGLKAGIYFVRLGSRLLRFPVYEPR